jgi:hypothetical protein
MAVCRSGLLTCCSLCTRFGIVEAGQESALDPKYTIVPQRERLERKNSAESGQPTG